MVCVSLLRHFDLEAQAQELIIALFWLKCFQCAIKTEQTDKDVKKKKTLLVQSNCILLWVSSGRMIMVAHVTT